MRVQQSPKARSPLSIPGTRMQAWRLAATSALMLLSATPLNTSAAPAPSMPPATKVYRCVQADGQTLYSQHACESPRSESVMQFSDARTKAQAKEGQVIQKRSKKLSKLLQRDRRSMARKAANLDAQALTVADNTEPPRKKRLRQPESASAGTKTAKVDQKAPKPLKPADFTAQIPGTKVKGKRKQSDNAAQQPDA